jgi:hypothetical protein
MYADRLQLFEDLSRQQDGDLRRTISLVLETVHRQTADPFAAVQSLLQTQQASSGPGGQEGGASWSDFARTIALSGQGTRLGSNGSRTVHASGNIAYHLIGSNDSMSSNAAYPRRLDGKG